MRKIQQERFVIDWLNRITDDSISSPDQRKAVIPYTIATWIKRLFDILVSLLVLIICSPILALIALAIKITSPGPVFYYQSRIGKNGERFRMYKFRTMRVNAGKELEAILKQDPILYAEWAQYQKLRDDPRITPFGKLLRRFSLDELPQLWNVIIGDMSIVGPRPYMPDQRDYYREIEDLYTAFRPGITGLWQVSGRNNTSYEDRVHFDEVYCKNWSLWLDFCIIVRTFSVVVIGEGAF